MERETETEREEGQKETHRKERERQEGERERQRESENEGKRWREKGSEGKERDSPLHPIAPAHLAMEAPLFSLSPGAVGSPTSHYGAPLREHNSRFQVSSKVSPCAAETPGTDVSTRLNKTERRTIAAGPVPQCVCSTNGSGQYP